MAMDQDREEGSTRVKIVDRRRYVLDDSGGVEKRPDAPRREEAEPVAATVGSTARRVDAQAPASASSQAPAGAPQSRAASTSAEDRMATQILAEFLNSMAHSMLIQLGEAPEPGSGLIRENLEAAQQTLEILSVLRRKTEGNLTAQEARMFDGLLYELMMRFRQRVEQQVAPVAGGPIARGR